MYADTRTHTYAHTCAYIGLRAIVCTCLGTFLVVTAGPSAAGTWCVEATDTAQHPAMHRTPHVRVIGPDVSGEVERT